MRTSAPAGTLVLTASLDVQDASVEGEVVAWGPGRESWSIDYQRWYGSPAQQEFWTLPDQWLQQGWRSEQGATMYIQQAVVDSGGHHTQAVYDFVRRRQRRRVFAIKGSSQRGHPLVGRPTRNNLGKIPLYPVGTDAAKDMIFDWLKLTEPGPGYCHFPTLPNYDEEYFAQITAEEKRPKYDRGVLVGYQYKKLRARNEALDLKVYNLVALAILNVNLDALAGRKEPIKVKGAPTGPPPPLKAPLPQPSWPPKAILPKRRPGFVTRWK